MKFISYWNWLNEIFSDDTDPVKDMGIGNKVRIEKWLTDMNIKSYQLTDDLKINVYDDVFLTRKFDGNLPEYIQFNLVRGAFAVAYCNMTSLRGCPYLIWGYFNCSYNNLTTLEYSPKEVHRTRQGSGAFHCQYQKNGKKFTAEEVDAYCNVEGRVVVWK